METVDFPPFGRCARIVSGSTEALATLEVGPRIIRLGLIGGENVFKVFEDGGPLGDGGCLLYGGHRLWVGPEEPELTYHADTSPPAVTEGPEGIALSSQPDRRGIVKSMAVATGPSAGSFTLTHKLQNDSDRTHEVFPWCLSVMAPGGTCLFPLPPFEPHTVRVTPAAPLALWSYTNLEDPRWKLGPRVIGLRQANAPPQKLGALVRQGVAAYARDGLVFIKTFPCGDDATYPDYGCNFEAFTNEAMLEVESLGPIVRLKPGEATRHVERWRLVREEPPEDDDACALWLKRHAAALS